MAKISAVGSYVALDTSGGVVTDISNDVTSIDVNLPTNLIETTGIDKSAPERIAGLQDSSVTLNGPFNDAAASGAHFVMGTGRTTARTLTIALNGNTTGNPKFTGEYILESYDVAVGDDRAVTYTAVLQLNDGVVPEWTTV